jgi:biopolymer transport protein ExbD
MKFRAQQAKERSKNITPYIMVLVVVGLAALVYLMLFKAEKESDLTVAAPSTQSGSRQPANVTAVRPPETTEDTTQDSPATEETALPGDLKTGRVLNSGNPGSEVYIEEFIQGDQRSIFYFHSSFSPQCLKYAPWLDQLDKQRDDIVVFRIEVNRPGISVPDLNSPVAVQFGLKQVPYFVIYNANGEETHAGQDAVQWVQQVIKSEGIDKK